MPRATVIAYHAVAACPREADTENIYLPPDVFERHIEFLVRRRRVVPLEALVHKSPGRGRPAVAITFDDAFRSVLSTAAPVLRRHGLPATVFVPTAWLGRRAAWYAPDGCEAAVMTADELREIERSGIAVESHGHGHIDLAAATPDEASEDIRSAAACLEDILGRRPRYLAYPWGRSSPAARAAARAAGFEAAFSVDLRTDGRYALERVGITRLDGRLVYALKTSGLYLGLRHSRLAGATYAAAKPLVRRRAH